MPNFPRRPLRLAGRALAGAALGAASLAMITPSAAASPDESRAPVHGTERANAIDGHYIVVLEPRSSGVAAQAAKRTVTGYGGRIVHEYGTALKGFSARLPARAVEALRQNPNVAYLEADQEVRTVDTQSGATWGLDRVDQRALPLNSGYTYDRTGAGVTAYVIDTGILPTHTEFAGRLSVGYSSISDGRGTTDCNGHGTHVAGTVGGRTYGVAKGVTLRPVRVLDCTGSGSNSGVIAGVDWVTAHHVGTAPAVANMSLGGGVSTALDTAVANSINDGVSYAVAAGNSNADTCNGSPSRVGPALTVGSTTSTDARSSFSNYGACLDLFAPGSSITSAWYTGDSATNTISGTSMATPHVAGVVALYLEADPTASAAAVSTAVLNASTPGAVTSPGTGSPNRLLYSVVGIPKAVQNLRNSNVTASDATVTWDAVPTATKYRVYWSTSSSMPSSCVTCTVISSNSDSAPSVKLSDVMSVRHGEDYYLKVSAINAAGKTITGWQSVPHQVPLPGSAESIPSTVTGIAASSVGDDELTLTWNRVPTATKYRIYYSTSSSMPSACEPNCTVIEPSNLTSPSHTLTGLTPGAVYYVKISAINSADKTITSWQRSPEEFDLVGETQVIPDEVEGISTSDISFENATVTWDKVPTAEKYRFYYSRSSSMPGRCEPNCQLVTPADLDNPSIDLSGLDNFVAGETYYVKISAINGAGKTITGWQSTPVKVRLDLVRGLEAVGSTVSWDEIPNAVSYRVYYSPQAAMPSTCAPNCEIVQPDSLSAPQVDLANLPNYEPGTVYYVKVSAIASSGKTITGWQDEPIVVNP